MWNGNGLQSLSDNSDSNWSMQLKWNWSEKKYKETE